MKIIFMGTPDFAVASVDAVKKAGHDIVLVVTQPDKPKGRSGQLQPSDVKVWAMENDIEVYQPERIRNEECVGYLRKYNADLILVTAFGQILPKDILDMPRLGCVNVHASLLPKYRGAAPIQWSIINGDKVTGVTTMMMGVGLDDGDMLLKSEVEIDDAITGGELFDKLSVVGGQLAVETIERLEKGEITPIPQVESEATHVGMIKKSMGRLDFSKSALDLSYLVRGLNPWPCAYTFLDGKMLKVWKATVSKEGPEGLEVGHIATSQDKKRLVVRCGEDYLELLEIQLEGKKRMSAEDFLRGKTIESNTKLG